MMYRVCWRSKITRVEGAGEPMASEDAAEKLVEEMNAMYPEIDHWIREEGAEKLQSPLVKDLERIKSEILQAHSATPPNE